VGPKIHRGRVREGVPEYPRFTSGRQASFLTHSRPQTLLYPFPFSRPTNRVEMGAGLVTVLSLVFARKFEDSLAIATGRRT
jgi:hypothetical protein